MDRISRGVCSLLFSLAAHAESQEDRTTLGVGPMVSLTTTLEHPRLGLGAELSGNYVLKSTREPGWESGALIAGGFLQGQWLSAGRVRLCAGPQLVWSIFGAELGGTFVGDLHGKDWASLHIAPFMTVGFAYLALRVDVPVFAPPGVRPEPELGVVLAFKHFPGSAPRGFI